MAAPATLLDHLARDLDVAVADIDDPVVRGRVVLVANALRRLAADAATTPGGVPSRPWPEVDA
jgi:hypothetical protein